MINDINFHFFECQKQTSGNVARKGNHADNAMTPPSLYGDVNAKIDT